MLMKICLLGITLTAISCELTGQNICEIEESYPVNITEFSQRNVTVRNYKWCMGFPPRCSFYTLKTVKVPEVVEKLETRLVRKCCPGFAQNENGDGCVPCKKCYEGICGNDGNCLCNSGFRGEDCADACEPLRWGANCQNECLCEHGACNPRSGKCDCPTGWFGSRCEVPCLEGFYGKHCIHRCSCGERDLCSPETGECSKKPPRQQEHQSTRAIHYMTEDIFNLTIPPNKQRSTPSLKKYYTFDMELDKNVTNDSMGKVSKNEKTSSNPSANTFNANIDEKTAKTQYNEVSVKHYTITLKAMEDSGESTTEMSAEVAPKIETVAIIDENGSLEKVISKEQSREIIFENIEPKYINYINKGSKEREMTDLNENEVRPATLKNKITEMNSSSENNSRDPKNLKPFETETSTNIYQPIVYKNYKSSKEEINISSPQFSQKNTVLDEDIINNPHNSPPSINMIPTGDEVFGGMTMHEIEDIIPPTPIITKLVTTSSISKAETFNNTNNLEDNELQNLEVMNVLTSRETTTQSGLPSSTIGSNYISKKAIVPFDYVESSTKSLDDNMRNELLTPEATENQIFMKEAYERRNGDSLSGKASEEYDSSKNSNMTTHMSMVALVSFILVLILSGIILAHHYTQRKRKENPSTKIDTRNFSGPHTVSVYTHSIFHTPLPEPPIFENPVFNNVSGMTSDQRTFQTHVVCSLNVPENKITVADDKEYTYDHPPSTGSYRAASIPEPPELLETIEPLYDEIPSNRRGNPTLSPPPSYKSSCLYMNTCGKTRF